MVICCFFVIARISVREYNCLRRAGIETVGDLLNKSESDMIRDVRNLGRRSLEDIMERLLSLGVSLKSDNY